METKRVSSAEMAEIFVLAGRLYAYLKQQNTYLFNSVVAMATLIALLSALQDEDGKKKLKTLSKRMETLRKYFLEEIEGEWDEVDVELFLLTQARDIAGVETE